MTQTQCHKEAASSLEGEAAASSLVPDRDKWSGTKSSPEFCTSTLLALGFLIKETSLSPLICYLLTLSSKSKSRDAQLVQNSKSAYLRQGVTDIYFFFFVEVVVRQFRRIYTFFREPLVALQR